jgi:hypothetical protein
VTKKFAVAALVSLSIIAGCSTTTTSIRPTFQETNVPDSLLVCPKIKKSDFPPDSATNAQVNSFIKFLYSRNMTCATNMDAVRDWLNRHNAAINQMNAKINKK